MSPEHGPDWREGTSEVQRPVRRVWTHVQSSVSAEGAGRSGIKAHTPVGTWPVSPPGKGSADGTYKPLVELYNWDGETSLKDAGTGPGPWECCENLPTVVKLEYYTGHKRCSRESLFEFHDIPKPVE